MNMKTKWIGEVWLGHQKVSADEDFEPRDDARQAYEDALDWASSHCPHPSQATCYGINTDDDADFFDEWSAAWLGLAGDEATTTISHVVCFTIEGGEITAIDEDGVRHPLRRVGGLLSRHARLLETTDEEELWAGADALAEEYMKELAAQAGRP